ncbi:MAG TPA: hypothetical protein VFK89_12535, partial [Actinomycetota bacterium]|nr:hypothetical protein [Actinomycetota bacterium]
NRGLQRGPSLRADVDGDALADEIYVALDPASGPPCAAFVVVVTASGPISEPVWEMGSQAGLPEPRLHGTVDINGDGVPEILVDEAVGASTQFVGALIATDGDLRRVEPGGNGDGATDGLFAYGGSVGHLEGVGCASEDRVVMSVATPGTSQQDVADGVYDVHRRFYELDGSTLKLDTTEEKHLPADRLDTELPEFATGPFGNC